MGDLFDLYCSLKGPATYSVSSLQFTGVPIPSSSHHLAKDSQGQPVVLFEILESDGRPPSIQLQNLQVEHALRCRIRRPDGGHIDSRFSLVRCQSSTLALQQCFFDLIAVLIQELPPTPTASELSQAIERIAALFLALERPPTRAVQGLWGELFLIANSEQPVFLVEAWHTQASEHYDFAIDNFRLEVKTSADRSRNHHFSYAQVYPPDNVHVVIASMFTERTASGPTLGELWDQTRIEVSSNLQLRLKIDEICIQSLGHTWKEARSIRFDSNLASQSLAFYDVQDIPRIPANLPTGLSEVRFRSDLRFGRTLQEAAREPGALVEMFLR